MTKEKLKFSLPAVFTIGPQENDQDAMRRYATLLTGESDGAAPSSTGKVISSGRNHVQDIVRGIIEGETRSIVSNMTIEEVFASRAEYKKQVIDKVHAELGQFGLMVYNANVKELEDTPGSEYFKFMRLKAHESAHNRAVVDVAQAQAEGNIGQQQEQSRAAKMVAQIKADQSVTETSLKKQKADAEALVKNNEIEIDQRLNLSRIAATRAAESKDAELQKDVEHKRADMELARLRAKNVVQAKIDRESRQEKAEAELFAQKTKADGEKYSQQANAEAVFSQQQRKTDYEIYSQTKTAEAGLYSQKQKAEGDRYKETTAAEARQFRANKDTDADVYSREQTAMAAQSAAQKKTDADAYQRMKLAEAALEAAKKEAEASYLHRAAEARGLHELAGAYGELSKVLGGPAGLMQYLMLKDNMYEKLALANAKAVQGLEPKINVWNTGADAGGDSGAAIRNIFQTLPPLMSTIQDQTGMTPPAWMMGMPPQTQAPTKENKALAKWDTGANGVKN